MTKIIILYPITDKSSKNEIIQILKEHEAQSVIYTKECLTNKECNSLIEEIANIFPTVKIKPYKPKKSHQIVYYENTKYDIGHLRID